MCVWVLKKQTNNDSNRIWERKGAHLYYSSFQFLIIHRFFSFPHHSLSLPSSSLHPPSFFLIFCLLTSCSFLTPTHYRFNFTSSLVFLPSLHLLITSVTTTFILFSFLKTPPVMPHTFSSCSRSPTV